MADACMITAAGVVTSVGHTAAIALPAIAAGLARPCPIHDYTTADMQEHQSTPIIGRPIRGVTDGFVGPARWLVMARMAFADLRAQVGAAGDERFWRETAVVVMIPSVFEDRFFDGDIESLARQSHIKHLTNEYAAVFRNQPVVIDAGRQDFIGGMHEHFYRAFERGARRLLLTCADSMIEPTTINWLESLGQIKDDLNPQGVVPGEAAVALLLEAPGLEVLNPWARGVRWSAGREDERPWGRTMGEVMDELQPPANSTILTDANGLEWRSRQLGVAQLTSGPVADVKHVADIVGDVGAASAGILVAAGAWFIREKMAESCVTIVSSDDGLVSGMRMGDFS